MPPVFGMLVLAEKGGKGGKSLSTTTTYVSNPLSPGCCEDGGGTVESRGKREDQNTVLTLMGERERENTLNLYPLGEVLISRGERKRGTS